MVTVAEARITGQLWEDVSVWGEVTIKASTVLGSGANIWSELLSV